MPADWTRDLGDVTIARALGAPTAARGLAYARQGRVSQLTVDPAGRLLSAAVQGARAAPYRVVVTPGGRPGTWTGHCSCPMAFDCKHVAAVLVATREQLAARSSAPPSWEASLAALVRDGRAATRPGAEPAALQLEVVDAGPYLGYGAGPRRAARRIRVRPVVRGRSGGWVRTGVSWRDIQYGAEHTPVDERHRTLLRAFAAAYLTHSHGYLGYAQDPAVHLDELGPEVWSLLARAADAGLELVPAKGGPGPVAVGAGVDVALDLSRAGAPGDTGVTLRPVLAASGGGLLATEHVDLVGDPAHGVFATGPAAIDVLLVPADDDRAAAEGATRPGLLLAPLTTRPDQRVTDLLTAGQTLRIPDRELPRFLTGYLPALRQSITVTSHDGSVDLPEALPPRLTATVTFSADHAAALDWGFGYAATGDGVGSRVGYDDDGAWCGDVLRDQPAEGQLVAGLAEPIRRLVGPARRFTGMEAVDFTRDVLPRLRETAGVELAVVGAVPEFREAELPPVIRMSAEDSAEGTDWFDLDVTVSVGSEEVPLAALIAALAEGRSHLVLASGTYLSLDRPELAALSRLVEEARALQDRASQGLRVSVYQVGLWEELLELGVVESQSVRWAGAVRGLIDLASVPRPPAPADLEARLRPYQLDGYQWLAFLWQHRLGGVLADDMGLGKTVQALALICRARESGDLPGPFLVVAPTSVVGNWAHEARKFAPGLKVCTVTETSARRATPLGEDVSGVDLVVTSYALFRIDAEAYAGLPWAGLILDEAQFVKNHQAKTYQCARRLPAPFKLAITGTPLENSLMDLWSLLSIVAPGLYPSPQRFSEDYRKPIERGDDPDRLATLRRRIRPLMLRRTKEQVEADLPPKQEQVLEVVLNPKHQRVYQTHLQRERQKVLGLLEDLDKNRFEIFRSLTLLRQLSLDPGLVDPAYADVSSSKADAFLDQLREVVAEGHRALVFSQFTRFLTVIRGRLDAEGIPYCYLDGRTRKRAERIAQFKDGTAPVFLISLKAGGVGLNLTEADYCFLLDPWWNPAVEAQAVDRTHRIGQQQTVMVYRLVARGTIEEKVMELKARKQSLFSRVMDDDGLMSAPLSVDDIRGLLA
jgi:superfamily II DNA or RNA helicase